MSPMTPTSSSPSIARRFHVLEGAAVSASAQAILDALDALGSPLAILADSGDVVSANAAWCDTSAENGDVICPERGDYLAWCGTMADGLGESMAEGVGRVLDGSQRSYEQTLHRPGAVEAVRVHVRRIEHEAPPLFLVSHELVAPDEVDDVEGRVLDARAEERETLAAELHDSVGQSLVCLGLGIDRINIASPPDSELAAILREMSNTLHRAHEEIRTLSFLLRPPWDDTPGAFERAVRELVDGFARRAGLLARIIVSGPPSPLCKRRELALFRILQEALVNIHRHAHADVVKVVLEYRADDVSLTIRDNGRGIASPEGVPPPRGVGILGMRARVEYFGGDLRILSDKSGTTVRANMPV